MAKGRGVIAALLLFSFALANCGPHQRGRIVFSSPDYTPHAHIYVMNADGSNISRLTYDLSDDTDPAWSPDGRRIAYASNRNGFYKIFLMDADGKNATQLTSTALYGETRNDRNPSWSPDGKRIAFDSNLDICVIDVDGHNLINLTNSDASDRSPTWSPNGEQIAFVSERGDRVSLYLVSADGSDSLQSLAEFRSYQALGRSATAASPDWSPDGTQILFTSDRWEVDGGATSPPGSYLYLVNLDGSGLRRVSSRRDVETQPAWSPDGASIVYVCELDDLCIIGADGSRYTRLNTDQGLISGPDWAR